MTELNKTPHVGKFKSRADLARKILELLESEVAAFLADGYKTPRILYVPDLAYRAALDMSKDSDTAHAIVKRFCTGYQSRILSYDTIEELHDACINRGESVEISYDVGATYVTRARLYGKMYANLSIATIILYSMPDHVSENLHIQADMLSYDPGADEDDDDVDEEAGKRPRRPNKKTKAEKQKYPYSYSDCHNANWRVVDSGTGVIVLKLTPFLKYSTAKADISLKSQVSSGVLTLTINGKDVNVSGYKPTVDSVLALLSTTHVLENDEAVLPIDLVNEKLPKTAIQKFVNLANGLAHTGKPINK